MPIFGTSMKGHRCPNPVAYFAEAGVVKWPGTYEIRDGKPGRLVEFFADPNAEGNGYWVYA